MNSWWKSWPTRRAAKKVISSGTALRLNLGCGRHLQDSWLNLDLKPCEGAHFLDARRPLPFPNSCASFVFSEHFIEHLAQTEGRQLLVEVFRVLKPGGVLRLSTPDLQLLCLTYQDKNPNVDLKDAIHRHKRITGHSEGDAARFFNDKMRYWGHKFIYDKAHMQALLQELGFVEISFHSYGKSPNAELQNLERHADVPWMERAECFFVEGQKP